MFNGFFLLFLMIAAGFFCAGYLASSILRNRKPAPVPYADEYGRQWHVMIFDRMGAYPYVIGPFPYGKTQAEAYKLDFDRAAAARGLEGTYRARLEEFRPPTIFKADKDLGEIWARYELAKSYERQQARDAEESARQT